MHSSATDLILVEYVKGMGVGGQRMLDPLTGLLYHPANTTESVNNGFRKKPEGLWENPQGSVVREVYVVPESEPVAEAPAYPAPKYPDGNPKSIQGAKKYSLRYIPLPALVAVGRAMEDGANKYGPANWRESGVAASVYIDAALRHIFQYFDGRQNDAEDSRVHNLGHAMSCLAIIIDAEHNGSLIDDRPFPCKDTDELLRRAK